MQGEKFTNTSMTIKALLGLIDAKSIAIPEIQRPFVWKKSQVRDLMDSLYKGYPTGYIILWKNPNVRLRNGQMSSGKKVIIDGQQRITAMMTAIAGYEVVNENFESSRIKIAFDPFAALEYTRGNTDAEIFAVQTPAHRKSKRWIPDIAEIFKPTFMSYEFIPKYTEDNPEMLGKDLNTVLQLLLNIQTISIGVVELSDNLNIDVVTDIFIRINSKGTPLSQGDFVMSKMAADELHNGNTLRKIIDYFSHLSIAPTFYDCIEKNDTDFVNTTYFRKLAWLRHDKENVYDPTCDDVVRVAFMHKFKRAKLADLVQLLSGRDFETRDYKEDICEDTYLRMFEGVENVINEEYFTQFMIAIRGAGFISDKLVNSNMAIDFAYTIFLLLIESKEVPQAEIKRYVQRWYVLSVLMGRYSTSPETMFAKDIRRINEIGVVAALKEIEEARLSDNFWMVEVTQNLANTSTNNPTYLVYLAAQCYNNDISLLSRNVLVRDLISLGGDVHHIFPKHYLSKNGFDRFMYNQNANYVYLDRQIHAAISDKAPNIYFALAKEQCETKEVKIGAITDLNELQNNLNINCVPITIFEMNHENYKAFIEERRIMMAQKIKAYYESL